MYNVFNTPPKHPYDAPSSSPWLPAASSGEMGRCPIQSGQNDDHNKRIQIPLSPSSISAYIHKNQKYKIPSSSSPTPAQQRSPTPIASSSIESGHSITSTSRRSDGHDRTKQPHHAHAPSRASAIPSPLPPEPAATASRSASARHLLDPAQIADHEPPSVDDPAPRTQIHRQQTIGPAAPSARPCQTHQPHLQHPTATARSDSTMPSDAVQHQWPTDQSTAVLPSIASNPPPSPDPGTMAHRQPPIFPFDQPTDSPKNQALSHSKWPTPTSTQKHLSG